MVEAVVTVVTEVIGGDSDFDVSDMGEVVGWKWYLFVYDCGYLRCQMSQYNL